MGNVSGRLEDLPSLYLRDQTRLSIASLVIRDSKKRVILRLAPNAYPSAKIVAKRDSGDEGGLIEYVQDPDPQPQGPSVLLKLTNEDALYLTFTFNIRRKADASGNPIETNINRLTFVVAPSYKDLENLVTREFHADPNLHKNPNVNLLGDYSTDRSPAVQFEWTWPWRAPHGAENKGGLGYRNACSFVEYDQRAHKLTTLAAFSFWVQSSSQTYIPPSSPFAGFETSIPPRIRVDSTSEGSRYGDSKTSDHGEPASPLESDFGGPNLATSISTAPSLKVDCPRPPESMMAEDGPLFRATIKSLEQKTGTFRNKIKKIIKRAEQAKQAQALCNEAFGAFMSALRDAASSNATGIQPALNHYFDRTFMEIQNFELHNEMNLQKLIIDPLTKLYNLDIKQAEAKKKDFEEESRDYYNFVSRYLGIKNDSSKQKKKIESDSKYQSRRKNFELKRFDYCSFMEDLHGGRKEQEVLSQLTKFADAQARCFLSTAKKVQEFMPELEALAHEVKETDKEFQLQRTEREERRRQLEKNPKTWVEPENIPSFLPQPTTPNPSSGDGGVSDSASGGGSQSTPAPTSSPGNNKFRGIRDLQEKDYNGNGDVQESERKKEGLLWALSRPGGYVDPKGLNKQAWHKYWVVLAGGQLCEYSKWKQKLDLHNEPINLRMASVREARNSERRFCFEVITPNYKRVYQATSEEDMNSWISAISNALKSTLEGASSVVAFDTSRIENDSTQAKDIQSVLTGKPAHSSYSHNTYQNNSTASSNLYRRTTVGARPNYSRRSSNTFRDDPEKLLQLIREADPSNGSCADCGSQVKTEWVSINLGIVLCIECSGLHRSLGTHISKVRSLTLDTISFTPDLVDLLCSIGNRNSNITWEATLQASQKPDSRSSRESRLKFITSKYVDRAWVQPLSSTLSTYRSPEEALLAAAERNDINGALHALALRANPNTQDPNTGLHAIYSALSAADPPTDKDITPPSPNAQATLATFPLAELLIQNGAEFPHSLPLGTLSHAARNYVHLKTAKLSGVSSLAPSNHSSSTSTASGDVHLSLQEKQQREKEVRLQKRISSGPRITRAPVLDRS